MGEEDLLGNNYLKFLVEELKPFIDATYSTRKDRNHTFHMGSSMGGLISAYAVAKYPDVFGGAGCLSQTFTLLQKVNVTMTIGQGNKAAVLAYLIPILLLLAVLFVCLGLGINEGLSALISIIALIPYYAILYSRREKLKNQFEYIIEPQ